MDEIETIMFPYNIVEQQGKELIDRCAEKGKAFIDMKPLAGGAIEDGRLALRYVLSNPAVADLHPRHGRAGRIGTECGGQRQHRPADPGGESFLPESAGYPWHPQTLHRCNYCAPCTVGIRVPVFLFHGYLERYGLAGWAHERYDTLTVKAGACIGCGKCETRCPYKLAIRDMLEKSGTGFRRINIIFWIKIPLHETTAPRTHQAPGRYCGSRTVILVMVLLIIETFRLLLPGLWTALGGDEQALSDYLTSEGRLQTF